MRYLYKYPQGEFPYRQLAEVNRARGGKGEEFELLDTGIFDQNRYFDIVIEFAKVDEQTIAMKITAHNRGDQEAPLHILPNIWFRNNWGWSAQAWGPHRPLEPQIRLGTPSLTMCPWWRMTAESAYEKSLPLIIKLGFAICIAVLAVKRGLPTMKPMLKKYLDQKPKNENPTTKTPFIVTLSDPKIA